MNEVLPEGASALARTTLEGWAASSSLRADHSCGDHPDLPAVEGPIPHPALLQGLDCVSWYPFE